MVTIRTPTTGIDRKVEIKSLSITYAYRQQKLFLINYFIMCVCNNGRRGVPQATGALSYKPIELCWWRPLADTTVIITLTTMVYGRINLTVESRSTSLNYF